MLMQRQESFKKGGSLNGHDLPDLASVEPKKRPRKKKKKGGKKKEGGRIEKKVKKFQAMEQLP